MTKGKMLDKKTRENVLYGRTRNMYLPEIFYWIDKLSGSDTKLALKNNAQFAVKETLRLIYDPNLEFMITPEQIDEYPTNPRIVDYDLAGINMYNVVGRLKSFSSERPQPVRERIIVRNFKEMVSAMFVDDIEFMKVVIGKVPVSKITEEMVREVFPDLLTDRIPETVKPSSGAKTTKAKDAKKATVKADAKKPSTKKTTAKKGASKKKASKPLSRWSIKELKAECEKMKIELPMKAKKKDLAGLIREAKKKAGVK
jgi:hypothetical protein